MNRYNILAIASTKDKNLSLTGVFEANSYVEAQDAAMAEARRQMALQFPGAKVWKRAKIITCTKIS